MRDGYWWAVKDNGNILCKYQGIIIWMNKLTKSNKLSTSNQCIFWVFKGISIKNAEQLKMSNIHFILIFGHPEQPLGSKFPNQGLNLEPQQLKTTNLNHWTGGLNHIQYLLIQPERKLPLSNTRQWKKKGLKPSTNSFKNQTQIDVTAVTYLRF